VKLAISEGGRERLELFLTIDPDHVGLSPADLPRASIFTEFWGSFAISILAESFH
jgi:hypothetical protein